MLRCKHIDVSVCPKRTLGLGWIRMHITKKVTLHTRQRQKPLYIHTNRRNVILWHTVSFSKESYPLERKQIKQKSRGKKNHIFPFSPRTYLQHESLKIYHSEPREIICDVIPQYSIFDSDVFPFWSLHFIHFIFLRNRFPSTSCWERERESFGYIWNIAVDLCRSGEHSINILFSLFFFFISCSNSMLILSTFLYFPCSHFCLMMCSVSTKKTFPTLC